MKVKIKDLKYIYEKDIKVNVKNKNKLLKFEQNKMQYFIYAKREIETNTYVLGRYNVFIIFEPKVRVVMNQNIYDKVINHYITRYILMPKLEKYLSDRNTATRKNKGVYYAINLLKNDIEYYKRKSKIFYFLKLDIEKYFYNIDHDILIKLLSKDLDNEEISLISKILDSTNKTYINNKINYYEKLYKIDIPKYLYNKGLSLGCMTSQFLAIYYLSNLQHFITCNLHLKFVNYMDDYIIIHDNKDYLKYCLNIIKEKLEKEYKLKLNNKKTYIQRSDKGITFLGYTFKVINNKTIITFTKDKENKIKKGIKKNNYLYKNNLMDFNAYFTSIENYKNSYKYVNKIYLKNFIDKYL